MKIRNSFGRKASAALFTSATPSSVMGVGLDTGHAGISKSLKFIGKNFSLPIQLKDLVKVSGMSRRGFQNAFQKHVGTNPGSFLRSVRMEQAKRLLIEHDLALKQIARLCGFRSENTFCVAFSREMKTSPKKFQRHHWLTACRKLWQRSATLLPSSGRVWPNHKANLRNRLKSTARPALIELLAVKPALKNC